ncbi:hypothetical protein KDH_28700 [Dictyobacter sp. S3.2.2.5]|uniref:Uncharacterized protein n=1 Tax=Dictyobacter halimunensis TaxID=3026934 RepID=A0ABQ6FP23_9CHLR|nr:hypothetical protein KDH_28700 [Dictyobacter sp. S3.2.2.5]
MPWGSLCTNFGEFKTYQEELIRDPIHLPREATAEQFQWAAFARRLPNTCVTHMVLIAPHGYTSQHTA